jgi:hypothetical protein
MAAWRARTSREELAWLGVLAREGGVAVRWTVRLKMRERREVSSLAGLSLQPSGSSQ